MITILEENGNITITIFYNEKDLQFWWLDNLEAETVDQYEEIEIIRNKINKKPILRRVK